MPAASYYSALPGTCGRASLRRAASGVPLTICHFDFASMEEVFCFYGSSWKRRGSAVEISWKLAEVYGRHGRFHGIVETVWKLLEAHRNFH